MSSLYDYRWQRARALFLHRHPFCVMCSKQGNLTVATVVDHRVAHRGDLRMFWDQSNWQSLCKGHHDGAKQREERRGYVVGCDINGVPIDPKHHWNKP